MNYTSFGVSEECASVDTDSVTAVPLTKIRHTGLVPVSSKLLITLDSGSGNNAVQNDGTLFAFHVSRASMYPSGFYQ